MTTALITGSSGFIGYHLAKRLLSEGWAIIGVDNLCPYYDPNLKRARQAELEGFARFTPIEASVESPNLLADLFARHRPEIVVHLAAQAGVRYSIDNPRAYLESNLAGTFELLEAARAHPPRHMLMASTSSAYGANSEMPYVEVQRADHPMSFYAATKKANEGMAHAYAHLYHLPITMFRFFTVYGPWGRPDMALFKFTKAILDGQPIDVYNHGDMQRDFTYIDDLVEAITRLAAAVPQRDQPVTVAGGNDSLSPVAPWRVVNIGLGAPVRLGAFIAAIERATGRAAVQNLMEMQAGDVPATWADTSLLRALTGFEPSTDVTMGVQRFVDWYRSYYKV